LRSSSAFVATVVPMRIEATRLVSSGALLRSSSGGAGPRGVQS
jgi:hypothetical protein